MARLQCLLAMLTVNKDYYIANSTRSPTEFNKNRIASSVSARLVALSELSAPSG